MKHIVLMIVCVDILITILHGQNKFIYYSYKHTNNMQTIIDSLKEIKKRYDECVMFYDDLHLYNKQDVDILISSEYFMSSDVRADNESFDSLCVHLSQRFGETVYYADRYLSIYGGQSDKFWSITFIMDSKDFFIERLCRLMSVSEVDSRGIDVNFLLYDSASNFTELKYKDIVKDRNISLLNFK